MDEKIDIALNIFAKPFQTSLAVLSLLRQSRDHIGTIWLQYEPAGSRFDPLTSYCIYEYLKEKETIPCIVAQPDYWLDLNAISPEEMADSSKRAGIRYQTAFEHSKARLLFLMHNDVFILKDILGAMKKEMGNAFAIGPLGQCWNCPAAHPELARDVLNSAPCKPDHYQLTRPNHAQLCQLYEEAGKREIFARPYAVGNDNFKNQPWPLPECRINEWACLLDLQKSRKYSLPFGSDYPPGAYQECGPINLDIGVAWFRAMHKHGLYAKNFDTTAYLRHWIGTGNNTPGKYAKSEDNALRILKKHFGFYIEWLKQKYEGLQL